MNNINYYELLEVLSTASIETIEAAYRAACKKYHPDIYSGDKDFAGARMKLLNEAIDTLRDEIKRAEYDARQNSLNPVSFWNTFENNRNQATEAWQSYAGSSDQPDALLRRAFIFLEDGDFKPADDYFEKVLDIDPENSKAYIGKLCAELEVTSEGDLKNHREFLADMINFKRALRFADEQTRTELKEYERQNREHIEGKRKKWAKSHERFAKYQGCIAAGNRFTVGLKTDGTVAAVGNNYYGQCNIADWRGVAAVHAYNHTVGLKIDGTVAAAGDNRGGQCNTSAWRDIAAVCAGNYITIGVKLDGTVVAAGDDSNLCNTGSWRDIVCVCLGSEHTIGLKRDGTVMAAGDNRDGRCNTSGWRSIAAVCAGDSHTAGLRTDGTVVAVGANIYGECDVGGWCDIVALSAAARNTVGLKADGTVVAAGNNDEGQCDVSGWRDIVAVSCAPGLCVGLKSDGTVVAAGSNEKGECNVNKWSGIGPVLESNLLHRKREDERLREEEQMKREQEHRKAEKEAERVLEEKWRGWQEKQRIEQMKRWVEQGLCRYCGGNLSVFWRKCRACGKNN